MFAITKYNYYKNRVSSVLNRDTKSYGKNFLCDGKEETCWNSDQVGYEIYLQLK
jgi:hypothetical protein